jgi:surfeit locus 1 family protein
MVALGVWQLRRAEWKAEIIARYHAAQSMSAAVPWPRSEADLEHSLFRWSGFTCDRVLGIRVTAATSAGGERCRPDRPLRDCRRRRGRSRARLVDAGEDVQWRAARSPGSSRRAVCFTRRGSCLVLERLAPPDPNALPNNHLMYADSGSSSR